MPDLLTLAAMKAYALGGRAKWKDYVDLYILLRDHFSLAQISEKSKDLFSCLLQRESSSGNSSVTFRMWTILKKWTLSFNRFRMKRSNKFLTDVATTPFKR